MFRSLNRFLFQNPLDSLLKRAKNKRSFLICWNRGLGDIALGLFAIVERIKSYIPEAEITFLTRPNLKEGFLLLNRGEVLIDEGLKRGEKIKVSKEISSKYDVVIEYPDPTQWVRWQYGKVVPKLTWQPQWEDLYLKFGLEERFNYVGVQVEAETTYGFWRNWNRWKELFDMMGGQKRIKFILFGYEKKELFSYENVIDLRGKTSLFEMLSIIKNRCKALVLPDSGILSMVYYLDSPFKIKVISLWGRENHGILKQGVDSPNPLLINVSLIFNDLTLLKPEKVASELFFLFEKEEIDKEIKKAFEPYVKVESLKEADAETGRDLFSKGKVAALILAGGMGTRLGHFSPKGLFPISPVMKKSLFQLIFERALAAKIRYKKRFLMAVMVSSFNREETERFLRQNSFFGLDEEEVFLFEQKNLLPLNENGMAMEEAVPDGNGSLFKNFHESGLFQKFREKGVEYISVSPVDNALSYPFEEPFFGFCKNEGLEVVLKAVLRMDPKEKLGVLAADRGSLRVVEYLDLKGDENYPFSSTGLFCFSMDFIERVKDERLPIHFVHKKGMWKKERFIFDILPFAKRARVLLCDREECFAPLKELENIGDAEKSLVFCDKRRYFELFGREANVEKLELSPEFYYPTEALLRKWKNREISEGLYLKGSRR